jgi:cytochrome d ubiquinol oxidase subunit II
VVEIWFALLTFTLAMFAVFDGRNVGAGALHLIVAKTDRERRDVIAAIGPFWGWHEVWLIAAGGTLILAFPRVMAAAFSGFYLALWMLVWSFLLRGVSLEVGGHIPDRLWQAAWDFVFAVSSAVLAMLFGVALGNLIRGVPIDQSGTFSMPLFTDFRASGSVGIVDWYTASVAIFTTLVLAAHGATYLRLKTSGRLRDRSHTLARRLWSAAAVLLVPVSWATYVVRPDLVSGLPGRPLFWLAVAVLTRGVWQLWRGLRGGDERRAFAGSCAAIASLLAGAAAAMFPVMLYSTLAPEQSVTAYAGATGTIGLALGLVWWPVAAALAVAYVAVTGQYYRGKVG